MIKRMPYCESRCVSFGFRL